MTKPWVNVTRVYRELRRPPPLTHFTFYRLFLILSKAYKNQVIHGERMDHVAFFLQLCGEAERYGCGCERGVDASFYRPKASRVLGDGTPLTWIPFCL